MKKQKNNMNIEQAKAKISELLLALEREMYRRVKAEMRLEELQKVMDGDLDAPQIRIEVINGRN